MSDRATATRSQSCRNHRFLRAGIFILALKSTRTTVDAFRTISRIHSRSKLPTASILRRTTLLHQDDHRRPRLSHSSSLGSGGVNGDDAHPHHHHSPSRFSSLLVKLRLRKRNGQSAPQHAVESETSSSSLTTTIAVVQEEIKNNKQADRLQVENGRLKERLQNLEDENQMLHYELSSRIVLESFEGEGKMRQYVESQQQRDEFTDAAWMDGEALTWSTEEIMSEQQQEQPQVWCDELTDDDACPIEPMASFGEALRDRAYWLVGLLVLQSCSGVILARNEALLANHPVIIYFLTMLVGAGGNAGNQASVRVIRGLALGTLNENTQSQFLTRELKMAGSLSLILSFTGFVRAVAFRTPFAESIAVTAALALIVFTSVGLGAILPLIMKKLRVDPAHSSTSIQVIMDILGVVLAVVVSGFFLDSPLGTMLISKLSFG